MDDDVDVFERRTKRRRRLMLLAIAVVVITPLAYFFYTWFARQNRIAAQDDRIHAQIKREEEAALAEALLPVADEPKLAAALTKLEAWVPVQQQAFVAATRPELLAAIGPGDKPCPVEVTALRIEIEPETCPSCEEAKHLVAAGREVLDMHQAMKADLARADTILASKGGTGLVVKYTTDQAPVMRSPGHTREELERWYKNGGKYEFTIGVREGIAWLYHDGEIVCAARFRATSTEDIAFRITKSGVIDPNIDEKVTKGGQEQLDRDFVQRTRDAIVEAMRAI